MRKLSVAVALATILLFLSACSQSPSKPGAEGNTVQASEPSSSGPVTGKAAYWKMYESAYRWAPDLVLLGLQPKNASSVIAGKAELWEATFASPRKREVRLFSYAAVAHPPDVRQGVSVGNAIPWGGMTRDVMPIEKDAFKIDSDAAYAAGAADAGDWLKKNQDKKLSSLQLGNSYNFPAPVWYLVWGDRKSGGYAVYVNATTGQVMKKTK